MINECFYFSIITCIKHFSDSIKPGAKLFKFIFYAMKIDNNQSFISYFYWFVVFQTEYYQIAIFLYYFLTIQIFKKYELHSSLYFSQINKL